MLMTLSFYAGAHCSPEGYHPTWTNIEHRSWIAQVLSVPAGWMVYPQLVVVLGWVAYYGWELRKDDPWSGWALFVTGLFGGIAISAALVRLFSI